MKKLLLVNLVMLSSLSYADNTYEYIDNIASDSPVYAQFLWRDKSKCSDSKNGSLFKVNFGDSSSDEIYPASGIYPDNQDYYCHATMNVYSDPDGKNLIAQEYVVWHFWTNDQGEPSQVVLHTHDTPPRVCTNGYSCTTNYIDAVKHLHLQITKFNKISLYNNASYPVYATFSPLGYCNQTLSSNSVYTIQANNQQALNNQISPTRAYDICNFTIDISADKQGNKPLCTIKGQSTGSNLQDIQVYSWSNTNGYCNSFFLNTNHDFAYMNFYQNN